MEKETKKLISAAIILVAVIGVLVGYSIVATLPHTTQNLHSVPHYRPTPTPPPPPCVDLDKHIVATFETPINYHHYHFFPDGSYVLKIKGKLLGSQYIGHEGTYRVLEKKKREFTGSYEECVKLELSGYPSRVYKLCGTRDSHHYYYESQAAYIYKKTESGNLVQWDFGDWQYS